MSNPATPTSFPEVQGPNPDSFPDSCSLRRNIRSRGGAVTWPIRQNLRELPQLTGRSRKTVRKIARKAIEWQASQLTTHSTERQSHD